MDQRMIMAILNDPEKMNKLAMNYDPEPIMVEMSGQQFPVNLLGGQQEITQAPYASWLNPGERGGMPQQQPQPGAAPIDPRSLGQLNSMMPQMPDPKFIGGAAPRQPTPVKIEIPDVSNLVKVNLGSQNPQQPLSLAQIMGVR